MKNVCKNFVKKNKSFFIFILFQINFVPSSKYLTLILKKMRLWRTSMNNRSSGKNRMLSRTKDQRRPAAGSGDQCSECKPHIEDCSELLKRVNSIFECSWNSECLPTLTLTVCRYIICVFVLALFCF
jgi:hypothetical protein